jgi:hypothetical protein
MNAVNVCWGETGILGEMTTGSGLETDALMEFVKAAE